MKSKMLVLLGAALLLLPACEKKQEVQAPPSEIQEESGTDTRPGEAGESQAETGTAPTMGDIREAREETEALPEGETRPDSGEEKVAASPTPQPPAPEKKVVPKTQAEPKAAAEKPAKGSAATPDTVVLANKNGDITFPHKAHTQLTECQTCHGDAGSGKIDLNRDSGHKLCLGCHKEQGAGPTACSGCHKKS